jgi:hypothetical protein
MQSDGCTPQLLCHIEEVVESGALMGCLAAWARWRVGQRDQPVALVAELAKTGGDVLVGRHGAESGSHRVQIVIGDLHPVDVAEHPQHCLTECEEVGVDVGQGERHRVGHRRSSRTQAPER